MPLNYLLFDQMLTLTSFRSGNHDPGDHNLYIIALDLSGTLDTPDQRRASPSKQKKVDDHVGALWEIAASALTLVPTEDKGKPLYTFQVPGDRIRKIVADLMLKYACRSRITITSRRKSTLC